MINEKYIRVGAKVVCNCDDRTNVNFGDHGTVAQIFREDTTLKILLDHTSDQDFCYWDYGTYPEDFSFVREEPAAGCEYISDLSLFPVPDSELNALLSREAHKRQRIIDQNARQTSPFRARKDSAQISLAQPNAILYTGHAKNEA